MAFVTTFCFIPFFHIHYMVRVTGFEPAVSAPPAQRFTGLSYTLKIPPKTVEGKIIPAYAQGGFPHALTQGEREYRDPFHDLLGNHEPSTDFEGHLNYTPNICSKTPMKKPIAVVIYCPITLLPKNTMRNTRMIPYCSIHSIPRRAQSGAIA